MQLERNKLSDKLTARNVLWQVLRDNITRRVKCTPPLLVTVLLCQDAVPHSHKPLLVPVCSHRIAFNLPNGLSNTTLLHNILPTLDITSLAITRFACLSLFSVFFDCSTDGRLTRGRNYSSEVHVVSHLIYYCPSNNEWTLKIILVGTSVVYFCNLFKCRFFLGKRMLLKNFLLIVKYCFNC